MIKKVRIAVDHGNRNMKTCSQVFTTGLTIQDKKPARGEKFLFYEGKYYVLSENRIPYQRDKTQDDRFFILTLFAIVKELEENPLIQPEDVIQVDLPIGLPPKHYAELCERYESYFKRQGKIHDINYCGSTYHITIGEVMAFPQDYAAMMTMIEKLQQIPKVVGIDIGGFTTDYLLMRKGNPDMEACDSMEKGVITMYNKIISGINSEYDILLGVGCLADVGCGGNACGAAVCGANVCGVDGCGAAACGINACPLNGCVGDACAANLTPLPGPFSNNDN